MNVCREVEKMETTHKISSLEYKVIKKDKKGISISIDEKGEIIVRAPMNMDYGSIERIIENKIDWIYKSKNIIEDKIEYLKSMGILQGQNMLWLGKLLKVEKLPSNIKGCHVEILDDRIAVYGNEELLRDHETVSRSIRKFYREKSKIIFNKRVGLYSKKINLYPNKINIRCQKTRWGSCSSNRNLSFNYKLLMAPIDVIDYIVVHELCHLAYMNHSKEYWSLVGSIIPQYLERRNWLKNSGYLLRFP